MGILDRNEEKLEIETRPCEICGKMFTPKSKFAKVCSEECKDEKARIYAREYAKTYVKKAKKAKKYVKTKAKKSKAHHMVWGGEMAIVPCPHCKGRMKIRISAVSETDFQRINKLKIRKIMNEVLS